MELRSPELSLLYAPNQGALGGAVLSVVQANTQQHPPIFLEFFAGSGLVSQGLKDIFQPVWANDVCKKKAAVYIANHGAQHFHLGSIADVKGEDLPLASLAWASFPCQDLSLADLSKDIHSHAY